MAGKTEIREKKSEIIKKFSRSTKSTRDTGSPETQIALITHRINELNGHFSKHKKDFHSQTGLLKMVGQRRRLLNYLKKIDSKRHGELIRALELRK